MSHADAAGIEQRDRQDNWTRLQAYCAHGHLLRYPPLTEAQARALQRTVGTYIRPDMQPLYTPVPNGFMWRPQLTLRPPATEEQLRAAEECLGFPLPTELRLLYTHIGNGGLHLGPCEIFFGVSGESGEDAGARPDGPHESTLEELVSHSGWRLHPRLEEALLRHPDRYVIVDSLPDRFLWIADYCENPIALEPLTGLVYSSGGWGYLPDNAEGGPFDLMTLEIAAPSLSVWFEQWIDETLSYHRAKELLPEQVETADLADPEVVWRGVYRFGPEWRLRPPNETDATDELFFDPDDIG